MIVNEYADDKSPVSKLCLELEQHLEEQGSRAKTIYISKRYIPGGLSPRRLGNLLLLHILFPLILLYFRVMTIKSREGLVVISTTNPPLIHWTTALAGLMLRIPSLLWYMDAHPDLECLSLKKKRFFRLADFLSFLDKKIIRLFQAYIALDEAMAVNLRTKACKPVFVANPWATYVTPSKPLALKDWEKTLKLVYAGNYGAAHDLSPFLQYLKGQPVIIKSQLSISFVGMPAPIGTALRDRFLEVGVAAEFLPRFSSFSKLLQFLHRFHFGIVSLKDCQRGLACPSKAFTYVSQGIPLCYVGPNKTLTDSLLEKGWGISYTQLADVIESGDYLENIRQNQGFSYPSVREESLGIMMSVLKGMQRGEQVWEQ